MWMKPEYVPRDLSEVSSCSRFFVDLTKLGHPDDIKKDMYGKWEHSGSHPKVFRCWFDELNEVKIKKMCAWCNRE